MLFITLKVFIVNIIIYSSETPTETEMTTIEEKNGKNTQGMIIIL